MAILKDLEVSIVVNDKPLTEYENDEEQLPNTSTIYIAAVSGAFQVEISCKKTLAQYGGTSLRFALELDGEEIDSVIMCKESKKVHMKGVQKCANGQCTMERYSFSDIDISITPLRILASSILFLKSRTFVGRRYARSAAHRE